jgi:hypothetical protein
MIYSKNLQTHLNNYTRATDNFPSFARAVEFAKASPLTELLVVVDFDQWDLMLIAQSLNKFLVHRLVAVFC